MLDPPKQKVPSDAQILHQKAYSGNDNAYPQSFTTCIIKEAYRFNRSASPAAKSQISRHTFLSIFP